MTQGRTGDTDPYSGGSPGATSERTQSVFTSGAHGVVQSIKHAPPSTALPPATMWRHCLQSLLPWGHGSARLTPRSHGATGSATPAPSCVRGSGDVPKSPPTSARSQHRPDACHAPATSSEPRLRRPPWGAYLHHTVHGEAHALRAQVPQQPGQQRHLAHGQVSRGVGFYKSLL